MTRILVVGVAVADYVFYVEEFPRQAAKYRAEDATIVGGGCAANAAVAISRLGGKPLLSARLAPDPIGDMILAELEQDGVDVALCDRSGSRSSFSSILIDGRGERQIVNFRGAGLIETTDHVARAGDVSAVLSDTRWSKGAVAAMEAAKARGVPGVLDVEAQAEADAFARATHLVFSEQGLASFRPTAAPAEAIAEIASDFGNWVGVTLGADGVSYHGPEGSGHVPGHSIEAVDTLGAGDVWHGAFTLRLAEGAGETAACAFANAAAALKCSKRGGREGIPSRAETDRFMKERTEWN